MISVNLAAFFYLICGLLFNDPFGVINTIGTLISNVGERGLAGFISLAIIKLIYSLTQMNWVKKNMLDFLYQ